MVETNEHTEYDYSDNYYRHGAIHAEVPLKNPLIQDNESTPGDIRTRLLTAVPELYDTSTSGQTIMKKMTRRRPAIEKDHTNAPEHLLTEIDPTEVMELFLKIEDRSQLTDSDINNLYGKTINEFLGIHNMPSVERSVAKLKYEIITNSLNISPHARAQLCSLVHKLDTHIDRKGGTTRNVTMLYSNLMGMIRKGKSDNIALLNNCISLDDNFTERIFANVLPGVNNIENLDSTIELLEVATNYVAQKLSKTSLTKTVQEMNGFGKCFYQAVFNNRDTLSDELKTRCTAQLVTQTEMYSNLVDQINHETLDHRTVNPLFESFLLANKSGIDITPAIEQAKILFSKVYYDLYMTEQKRLIEESAILLEFAETFGLDRIASSIRTIAKI